MILTTRMRLYLISNKDNINWNTFPEINKKDIDLLTNFYQLKNIQKMKCIKNISEQKMLPKRRTV